MDDNIIVDLFWERDTDAITANSVDQLRVLLDDLIAVMPVQDIPIYRADESPKQGGGDMCVLSRRPVCYRSISCARRLRICPHSVPWERLGARGQSHRKIYRQPPQAVVQTVLPLE